jgi:hypothetical protein
MKLPGPDAKANEYEEHLLFTKVGMKFDYRQ